MKKSAATPKHNIKAQIRLLGTDSLLPPEKRLVVTRFKVEAVDGKRHFQRLRGCVCSVPGCGFGGQIVVHHERRGTGGGTALKPPPGSCVPLCDWHHRLGHQIGWATFETKYGVNLREVARGQALVSRGMGLLPPEEPTE